MGIRLDWEIEAEKSGAHKATEDPELARARRRAQLRFIFTFLLIIAILGGIGALVAWRLREADARIEQFLRDTVEAEVAALRIGDWNAFSKSQRSADPAWIETRQRSYFDQYQELKIENDVRLTGTVRDLKIEGSRARVLVEEIIDGVPYVQPWFYWRYEDGWRHVPPDYTFWGDTMKFNGSNVVVLYRELDEAFAREMGIAFENWVNSSCAVILQCGDFPHITLNVVTDEGLSEPVWSIDDPWRMDIPSPYLVRARFDQPFSGEIKVDVADLLAKRLVEQSSADTAAPLYPNDAYYLRPAVASWLVGRFVALNTNSLLVESLAQNYGSDAVGRLLRALRPDSSMEVLADVTGVSNLGEANLDWRDFLTWRLTLENQLYSQSDENAYVALYTPQLEATARERYAVPYNPDIIPPQPVVTQATMGKGSEGTPEIEATVVYNAEDGTKTEGRVLFRLVDNVWKRAS
jgi:hypothetical protein